MRNLILIMAVICLSFGLQAQSSMKYTKVLIDANFTEAQAKTVTDAFYQNADVETARMDPTTNILLCVYEESLEFNELSIITWLGNEGYLVKCYYTDVFGFENIVNLQDVNCK